MNDGKTFLQRVEERKQRHNPTPTTTAAPVTAPPIPLDAHTDTIRKARYAEAALRAECDQITGAVNGTRNDTLNRAAFSVARFVNDGILGADYVTDQLTRAARTAGLPDTEIRATLNSAAQGSLTKPRTTPAVPPPTTAAIDGQVLEVNGHDILGETNPAATATPKVHPIWGSHTPVAGAAYLFDHEDTQTALWGDGEHILWAEGEALMIAGGMGLGKTTLAGQLVRAQLGLDAEVLGLPVTIVDAPILYLAMDRPRQIRRSMLRQFHPTERDALANLLIRPGPPIADIAARPTLLVEMAIEAGAGTIYIDSLKDAAVGLSSDEVGAAYNRARQFALANNVQVCELHHLIKRNPMGGSPNSVADVYGSNWLTAGAGSVVMLTGDPGDPIVEFRHAKQPHTEVGPFRLLHNQTLGRFTIDHEVDLLVLAAAAGANGLSAQGAAAAIFEREKPTRAQVEKARRRLDKLVNGGQLVRIEGMKGGAVDGVKGGGSANYFTAP